MVIIFRIRILSKRRMPVYFRWTDVFLVFPVPVSNYWKLHKLAGENCARALDRYVKELKSPGALLICCRPTVCLVGVKDGKKKVLLSTGKVTRIKTRCNKANSRSQWPRNLRRGSAATRLLKLWVRIPPGAWLSVSCECCVLSGSGLCDGLISHSEEFYWRWCVAMCDL